MNILRSRIYDAERQRIDAGCARPTAERFGSGDRASASAPIIFHGPRHDTAST